jgi:hypothetical protein|tara:strand:- start:576 stop:785 length:210 start_codon:yes stop_codon:yes gene_type:complete
MKNLHPWVTTKKIAEALKRMYKRDGQDIRISKSDKGYSLSKIKNYPGLKKEEVIKRRKIGKNRLKRRTK